MIELAGCSRVLRLKAIYRQFSAQFHGSPRVLAGHSKWANIRHDKAKNDAKKSREAYSIAARIESSVKTGGVDGNAQLATLVEKARKLNVTKKIIDNAVKRGTGEISSEGVSTDVTYEFMGPGGVACIIEASTDNKNRTIGLVKHAMSKFSSSLSPCLYAFERKGLVVFEPVKEGESLDDVLEVAIELGAEDVEYYNDEDGVHQGELHSEKSGETPGKNDLKGPFLFRMITDPGDLHRVSNSLSQRGYILKDSSSGYLPTADAAVGFPEGHEKGLNKALELLDEIPEVTNYYLNIKD